MTTPFSLSVHTERWAYQRIFRITGHTFDAANVLVVSISDGLHVGHGACSLGIYYLGETLESMEAQVMSVKVAIEAGLSREALLELLPRGGARNAIDCALWDLEAKSSGESIWTLTGIQQAPVQTVYTIGIESTPALMAEHAREVDDRPLLKIKLDGEQPVERVAAIRQARPDATLLIDANQAWTLEQLTEVAPKLADLNVDMIEQPLPRGADEELEGYQSPILLCADESCLDRSELGDMLNRYHMINVKLDKTGGLTEALLLAEAVEGEGLSLMVGNMGGTSLCMAPGMVVAQKCRYVDLDGPLLLKGDQLPGLAFEGADVGPLKPVVWG